MKISKRRFTKLIKNSSIASTIKKYNRFQYQLIQDPSKQKIYEARFKKFIILFNHTSRVYWIEKRIQLRCRLYRLIDSETDTRLQEKYLEIKIREINKIMNAKDRKLTSIEDVLNLFE